jgi:hypothetical protein
LGRTLFTCSGGHLALPEKGLALVGRKDGGNLLVLPPRVVWERGELTPAELTDWSFLVAAAGQAMLCTLPQLDLGCINYFEAGNWALNFAAEPRGHKTAPEHRRVHMHLLGRSRTAADPSWLWGEAPKFPSYADREAWALKHELLSAAECKQIVAETERIARALWFHITADFAMGDLQRLRIPHGNYAATVRRPLLRMRRSVFWGLLFGIVSMPD